MAQEKGEGQGSRDPEAGGDDRGAVGGLGRAERRLIGTAACDRQLKAEEDEEGKMKPDPVTERRSGEHLHLMLARPRAQSNLTG